MGAPQKDPNRRQGRRSRQRRPLTVEERAQRVFRELEALAAQIAADIGASFDQAAGAKVTLPTEVGLPEGAQRADRRDAAVALVRDLRQQIGDAARAMNSFHDGRVYCFFCDQADCRHSAPDRCDETFWGYTATGRPVWQSLTNVCIELGDDRVDQLFGPQPELLLLELDGSHLTQGLLAGFGQGSRAWRLVGQVVIGPLNPQLRIARQGDERRTVTLQVIETCAHARATQLRLNLVGLSAEELATVAAASGVRSPAERFRRMLWAARQRLETLSRRVQRSGQSGDNGAVVEDVNALLGRLANDVRRIFNSQRRRTRHAQQRHLSGERPTSRAVADVERAPRSSFLADTRRDTIVVIGGRGRAHVFSRAGKHVTSLQLDPGEVARKTAKERWLPLPSDEVETFRRMLAHMQT